MNIRQVTSSSIAAVGYKRGTLVVAFTSGAVYVYRNVASYLYATLFRSRSIGRAFAKHIRSNPAIPYTRVA